MSKPLITLKGTGISIKVGARTVEPVNLVPNNLFEPREQSEVRVHTNVRNQRDRKVRSTSFNVTDPLERQLNAHADRFSCFSTYVKRLIHEDVMRGNTSASSTPREDRYYDAMTSDVAVRIGGGK